MDFDRLLGSAQVAGNLFVQFASDHIFKHFPLRWCERGQARADFGKFGLLPPKGAVFLNRHTNRCKQVFIVPGLVRKSLAQFFIAWTNSFPVGEALSFPWDDNVVPYSRRPSSSAASAFGSVTGALQVKFSHT